MNQSDDTFSYIDIAFARHHTAGAKDDKLSHFLSLLMKRSREGALSLFAKDMKNIAATVIHGPKSPVVEYKGHYYLRRNWDLETQAIDEIKRLSNARPTLSSVSMPPSLNKEQSDAFKAVFANPFVTLSGGPGSGKTHFANALINEILSANPKANIISAAPTGKAAYRLQHPGIRTGTLHSLLKIRQQTDLQKKPPPLIADIIIVDECSMIDLPLWSHLLNAIETGAHLVLLGDPHQLPPIGTSSIFSDLGQSKYIPSFHLHQIVRTDRSDLIELANLVKEGRGKEALSLIRSNPPSIKAFPLPKTIPLPVNESTALLTPFTKGPYGTTSCNAFIDQQLLSTKKPIVISQNDYKLGLMNGERGFIEDGQAYFTIGGETKTFKIAILPPFELAYATTVHKSQGSEFDHVIFLLPDGNEVLTRELLYTGITRAKRTLELYFEEPTLLNAINASQGSSSNLNKRLGA